MLDAPQKARMDGKKRTKKSKKKPQQPEAATGFEKCQMLGVFFVSMMVSLGATSYWKQKQQKGCPLEVREVSAETIIFAKDMKAPDCPFVVRNVSKDESWLGDAFWAKLAASPMVDPVEYDVLLDKKTGVFRYWDNKTLFAAEIKRKNHKKIAETSRKKIIDKVQQRGVRYGGTMKAFAAELEHSAYHDWLGRRWSPKEKGSWTRPPGLWLSGPGTGSSAHYDAAQNFYIVTAGQKTVDLAGPGHVIKDFDVYPMTHPEARQAKIDAFSLHQFSRVHLNTNDAVFIPSGYIHRFSVVGSKAAGAVTFTTLPHEFTHFNKYLQTALPFLSEGGPWTQDRLASALRHFVISFMDIVVKKYDFDDFFGFAKDTCPDPVRRRQKSVFNDIARRSYDDDTRDRLRLPAFPDVSQCPFPDSNHDQKAAQKAANDVAAAFNEHYRPSLRLLYLTTFLENVLTRVTPPTPNTTGHQAISASLSFIDHCLL